MKIAAWSDGHGTLPEIKERVDIVIIAGDFTPLDVQRYTIDCKIWFERDFFNYIRSLDCEKVFLVPGNHDFLCERTNLQEYIHNSDLRDKLIYLIDESYEYNGLTIYGCPWCTGPFGWAFSPIDTDPEPYSRYKYIPDNCDILITHQPPKVDKVGCSNPYTAYERDFGSDHLRNILDDRHIKLHFCGHIHTGEHNGVSYGETKIYNVSLKNEGYSDVYDVTYISI